MKQNAHCVIARAVLTVSITLSSASHLATYSSTSDTFSKQHPSLFRLRRSTQKNTMQATNQHIPTQAYQRAIHKKLVTFRSLPLEIRQEILSDVLDDIFQRPYPRATPTREIRFPSSYPGTLRQVSRQFQRIVLVSHTILLDASQPLRRLYKMIRNERRCIEEKLFALERELASQQKVWMTVAACQKCADIRRRKDSMFDKFTWTRLYMSLIWPVIARLDEMEGRKSGR